MTHPTGILHADFHSQNSASSAFEFSRHYKWLSMLILAAVAYLAAATGGLGLPYPEISNIAVSTIIIAVAIGLLMSGRIAITREDVAVFLLIFLYFVAHSWRSEQINLYIRKIDGGLIGSITAFIIFRGAWSSVSDKNVFLKAFVQASLVILICTLVYKMAFGINAREVRFLLNGPIVFAWMMGIACLSSLYCLMYYGEKKYAVLAIAFISAIIWTGSKGPIIALLPALVYVMASTGRWSKGVVILASAGVIIYFAGVMGLLPERLSAISRLWEGELSSVDEGSVGIRQRMWADSWDLFIAYPVFGVGMGNWPAFTGIFYITNNFIYPHNIIFELLSEHGVFGSAYIAGILYYVAVRSSNMGRAVLVFSIAAMMFTGDAEYWRFILAIPLAMHGRRVCGI